MSLILDALNRADTERKNQTPVPDLNTQHRPLMLEPDQASRSWIWLVVAGVIMLLAAVVLWRWLAAGDPPPAVAPIVPAVVQVPPTTPAVPVGQSGAATQVAPTMAGNQATTRLASAAAIAPEHNAVAANDVKSLYADETAPPTVEADVNQLYAVEESVGSESVIDPFASVPVTPEAVPPVEVVREPARTFDSMTHIQDFNELPWNTKQKMPTISYQRHDYLAGGISSVVINGQTLGVGNLVTTGQFVVQDILVDGVVLKHGDKVFKLRALNGWINM
ncbi:general secretion pathway protein GspB [Cellvibrio mixtus]|nr:general secretion pathway protein GspB [Cellvibrio mixtus]